MPQRGVCVCVFETRIFCVIALAVLELKTCFVDQARLELTELHLPLPPECWD